MRRTEIKELYLHRYDRRDLISMICTNRQLIDWVSSQILEWGNIEGKAGCVYGITSTDEESHIKAQYIINVYADKELTGCSGLAGVDERRYIRENRVQIYVQDVEDYYQEQIGNVVSKGDEDLEDSENIEPVADAI